ncbi:DUF899 domain-containing protein [Gordonia sputi]|uniref:DUF899 domain-containing protein n=1 Tax=Gordonia sputi NBRC 100414 TaxID=1089453 RepID=H5U2M5_9ACTN|nr:DUF899 domain-containing protein [Gordonia sputi]NKY95094.1 DUF899 domain-containing protein [Gordonia sputi]GAB39983.1 hypothetical protein GOSPT_085_01010 [Gordonia sputi NBRC 100414]
MTSSDPDWPAIVDRAAWDDARSVLLQQEKALTRMKDAVSAARRRMPMVEVRSDYAFEGANGRVTLLDLFDGRPQLIVQHFMFGPDWEEGCDGCSMMADHIGPLSHLHARRTSFVLTSRAPLDRLSAFRDRMGWQLPWYSTVGDAFNTDFGATVDGEERQAISVFLRRGDRVFHTWSTFGRGEETFMLVFDLLDLTPFGRQEDWENSPPGVPQEPTYSWMRLSDRYEND